MATLLGRIGAAAAAHTRRAMALVALVLVLLGVGAATLGGAFTDDFSVPGTESQQATDLLQQRFPAASGDSATVVFAVQEGTLRDGERPQAVERAVAAIARQPHVSAAIGPLSEQGQAAGQLSRDGRIGYVAVQYDRTADALGAPAAERLEEASALAATDGIEVSQRGAVVDMGQQQTAPVGELVGVAVAVVVLTLVFRSVVAMTITLVSAGIALAAGLLLLTLGAGATTIPTIAPTLAVMLGLGAGIDYALLLVGRLREQLAAGDDVPAALRTANATAGASVVAAGAIVVVAIAGLLATGIPFVGRMGLGSALVVAAVAVGAVTVLPTLLAATARRLRPRDPAQVAPSAAFARWGERVTARPWLAALAGIGVLVVLAAPVLDLRLGQPDDGNDAEGSTTRVAYDRLAEGFGPGVNGPLVLAAALPREGDASATLRRLERRLAATEGVSGVSPAQPNERGDAAVVTVVPASSPQDQATSDLVERLRDETIPATTRGTGVAVHVGGATATMDDLSARVAERLPVFVAAVVGLSVLLLMAVFRSVWVPLVSAAFNLLSIGAAYGVVVAVFQWEWAGSLLGVDGSVPIVSFIPMFMFAVLFGLSMDYNVFLQSRIREERLRGAAPRESVVVGLSRVAKVILAAGAIMTAVFAGFITDDDVIVKMIGFGLAVAILIDVLVVRLVVAPAVMALLGERAWGLPRWLDRLLPDLALEGREASPQTPGRAQPEPTG
jgi:RND superfamily putative drug exporter